jgi:hypothetical protein
MNEVPLCSPPPETLAHPASLAFLSYLRLSIYMAVVSIAIVISFHLKSEPTNLELRMARPLGIIFWLLSLCCLALGFGNYIKTVSKYSLRAAIVQTGWKTQTVSLLVVLEVLETSGVCDTRRRHRVAQMLYL